MKCRDCPGRSDCPLFHEAVLYIAEGILRRWSAQRASGEIDEKTTTTTAMVMWMCLADVAFAKGEAVASAPELEEITSDTTAMLSDGIDRYCAQQKTQVADRGCLN